MTESEKYEQLIMDFKSTFGSPEGQRVLIKLEDYCVDRLESFTDSELLTYYRLGAYRVYRYIVSLVNSNPKEEIQTEAKE